MNTLKLILKPAFLVSRVELLCVTVFALFFVVSPTLEVFGDPFAFGAKNEQLVMTYPLVGIIFFGLFLIQAYQKKLQWPQTNIQIGVSLIALAVVINGYFSATPEYNLYWLLGLGFLSLSLFWSPLAVKVDLAMILFLIGLIIGTANAIQYGGDMALVATGWACWFWYFFPRANHSQQNLMVLLTVSYFVTFGFNLLAALVVGKVILDWWKQKQKFRRKAQATWWFVFICGLSLFGFLLGISLRNWSLPVFENLLGAGMYQAFPTIFSAASSVVTSSEILTNGLSVLWLEWGISLLVLVAGLWLVWARLHGAWFLWVLFLGLLVSFPSILNQPYFWCLVSFFTFSVTRFLPTDD